MKITSAHAIAFTALVASVGGGLAVAHNGDTDKIHFCIDNANRGAVRAVAPDATCDTGETPRDVRIQNVAYEEGTRGSHRFARGAKYRPVSKKLLVPADGQEYALTAKLSVSKRAGDRGGNVSCLLHPTDNTPPDVVTVTVRPGESEAMSFITHGKTDGRAGTVAAVDVRCRSASGPYTISAVKILALPMNTVSKGVPVA